MRIIIIFIALMLLANAIAFLLPTKAEVNNLKYTSKQPVNEELISLINENARDAQGTLNVDGESLKLNTAEPVCYKIGPFLRDARVAAAGVRLEEELALSYTVDVRESTEVEATRVYVGPYPTTDIVAEARKELTNSGILDHFFKKDGDQYIVSLGIYANAESAAKQQARYRALNVDAKLRPEATSLPKTFWLEVEGILNEVSLKSLSQLKWGESSVNLSQSRCKKAE